MTRTPRKTAAALGAAAITLVGLGYLALRPAGPGPAGSAAAPSASLTSFTTPRAASCVFAVGDHGAYRFESSAEANLAAMGHAGDKSPKDFARMLVSWEVTRAGATASLRAAMTSLELRQDLSQPEQKLTQMPVGAFEIEVAPDCRVVRQAFRPDWTPGTRQFVSTIVRTFEFATGPGTTWQAEQTDGLGTYLAHYRASPDASRVTLTKAKRHYRSEAAFAPGFEVRVQVLESSAVAQYDKGSPWLVGASGHERIRIESRGQLLADLDQTFDLKRDDASYVVPAKADGDLDDADPFKMPPRVPDAIDPAVAALGQAEALARFAAIFAQTRAGDAYGAALFLAQWLRAHPEQAELLTARIRSGSIDEKLRPALFLALERCGTPEAQRALAGALADSRMTEMDRARAASALSDVPTPTPEVGKALTAAAKREDSRVVAGSSLRALGHYEERLATDPAQRAEVRTTLRESLAQASDGSRRVDSIDAIGNTGDRELVADLKGELAAPQPSTREHAIRAFRRMPADDARGPLLARLPIEPEPSARIAIVETLIAVGERGDDSLAIGAGMLPTEPVAAVRAAIIKWLGGSIDRPAVRTALAAWFPREPAAELQQLIGHYLPADSLPP